MNDGASSGPLGQPTPPFGRRLLGSTSLLRALLSEPTLDRGAKLCYAVMCAYGRDSGRCFMAARTLAQDLRCSVRQIERWWRSLERAGFIRPEWRAGRPTHYTFLAHPIFERAAKPTPDMSVTPPLTRVSPTPDMGVTQGKGSKYRTEDRRPERSPRAVIGPPSKPRPPGKPTTTTPDLVKGVRAEIWGYFQGEGRERVNPPDRDIVRQCVEALHGHSLEELRMLLRDRFRRGYRPGTAHGPRDYTWFPRVLDNAFRPRE